LCPYTYIYNGAKTTLIWQTGAGPDTFKLDRDGSLIAASSKRRLQQLLGREGDTVQWSEGGEVDFDKFWRLLKNLRPNRASSQRTCEVLLSGWNFIEDLLRTFDLNQQLEGLHAPIMNKAYQKVFYGNNLPSITPKGRSYQPIWLRKETLAIRKEFGQIWSFLVKAGYLRAGKPRSDCGSGASLKRPSLPRLECHT